MRKNNALSKTEQLRLQNREYIRVQQNNPAYTATAFQEQCIREDVVTLRFDALMKSMESSGPPDNIRSSLGKVWVHVDEIVRKRGGSLSSVIRAAFLNWDGNASGGLDFDELRSTMLSIGVTELSNKDIRDLLTFYLEPKTGEMRYQKMIEDIQKHYNPPFISYLDKRPYERPAPSLPEGSLSAGSRAILQSLYRNLDRELQCKGGSIHSIVSHELTGWDRLLTGKISLDMFCSMLLRFGVRITQSEATCLIQDMHCDPPTHLDCNKFLKMVSRQEKSLTHQPDISATSRRQAMLEDLNDSYKAKRNSPRLQETKFIREFKNMVIRRVKELMPEHGGDVQSWLKTSFLFWDKSKTGTVTVAELQGAMSRIGLQVSLDDCDTVAIYYSAGETGCGLPYRKMIHDIAKESQHFLSYVDDSRPVHLPELTAIVHPEGVDDILHQIRVKLGHQTIEGNERLAGLLLRYEEPSKQGSFISARGLKKALHHLHVKLTSAQVRQLMQWYGNTGGEVMDYGSLLQDVTNNQPSMERNISTKSLLSSIGIDNGRNSSDGRAFLRSLNKSISLAEPILKRKNMNKSKKI